MTRRSKMEDSNKAERSQMGPDDVGASGRAVSIARIIDRLCRAPGTYQVTVVVPVHRRSPWQITYARVEVVRNEAAGTKDAGLWGCDDKGVTGEG